MTGGRPLRFLALSLGGWVMMRAALLLPEIGSFPPSAIIPRLIKAIVPDVAAAVREPAPIPPLVEPPPPRTVVLPQVRTVTQVPPLPQIIETPTGRSTAIVQARPAIVAPVDTIPSPVSPPIPARNASRLNGSAWLLVRGGPAGTVSGGQLGASQGGMRLTYALGDRRRVALAARIAAPLRGAGREAALGIEWQPTRLPIRLVAEQRFVLDGGRGGPTVGVIAGYGPSDIAPGIRLEAYGQAGAIARDTIEGFVDASTRVTHPFGAVAGVRIDAGIGAWGSAQRAAERLDIGPTIVATMPVAGKSIRLALDWRERITGTARPGSGPALSIGSDF